MTVKWQTFKYNLVIVSHIGVWSPKYVKSIKYVLCMLYFTRWHLNGPNAQQAEKKIVNQYQSLILGRLG